MRTTVMTPFKNKKEKKKMVVFLKKHFRTLKKITENIEFEYLTMESERKPTDKLLYGPEKKDQPALGFDYSNGGIYVDEKDYMFRICQWMSLMNGVTKLEINGVQKPFIIDSFIERTVFVDKKGESENRSIVTDKYGFNKSDRLDTLETISEDNIKKRRDAEKLNHIFKEELIRLTELWGVKE